MAASRKDAEVGWNIFRDADFALSLAEINRALVDRGYAAVSERTYRHYGKLERYGYSRYVPINQLDVKTLRDPFVDQASRSREHPIQTIAPVELRVLDQAGEVLSFQGDAVELATSESVVRLRGAETTNFFSELGNARPAGELLFKQSGEVRRGRIERLTLNIDDQLSTVRVSFAESLDLRPLVEAAAQEELVTLHLAIGSGTEVDLKEVARYLYWLSQAADAARLASAEIGVLLEEDEARDLRQPVVRDLRIGSVDVTLDLVLRAGAILFAAITGGLKVRSQYWSSTKEKAEARRLRWENERDGIRWGVDKSRFTSWLRSIDEPDGEVDATPSDALELEPVSKVLNKQLMPAVMEIIELADGNVEIRLGGISDSQIEAIRALDAGSPIDDQ